MTLHLPDPDSPKTNGLLTVGISIQLDSLSYCGVTLERRATCPSEGSPLGWECLNFTLPCNILRELPQICWDCVAGLDKVRDAQGYRPVVDELKNPNDCQCAVRVLMQQGCKCRRSKKP